MRFSKEQIKKGIACKTLEEFKTLAKAENVEFSEEDAERYFNATREVLLSNEDLDVIAGGKGDDWKPLYYEGQHVTYQRPDTNVQRSGDIVSINKENRTYKVFVQFEYQGHCYSDVEESWIISAR